MALGAAEAWCCLETMGLHGLPIVSLNVWLRSCGPRLGLSLSLVVPRKAEREKLNLLPGRTMASQHGLTNNIGQQAESNHKRDYIMFPLYNDKATNCHEITD